MVGLLTASKPPPKMATHFSTTLPDSVTLIRAMVGTDQVAPRSGAPLASSSSRAVPTESVNSQRTDGNGSVPQPPGATLRLLAFKHEGRRPGEGTGAFPEPSTSGWVMSSA